MEGDYRDAPGTWKCEKGREETQTLAGWREAGLPDVAQGHWFSGVKEKEGERSPGL